MVNGTACPRSLAAIWSHLRPNAALYDVCIGHDVANQVVKSVYHLLRGVRQQNYKSRQNAPGEAQTPET
jgi:hypothetical protein